VCVYVCVWATLPDLNKMDRWMDFVLVEGVGPGLVHDGLWAST